MTRPALAAALDQEAAGGEVDQFGHRYVIDFPLEQAGRRALVRLDRAHK